MMNIVELSKRCINIAEELGLTHEKLAELTNTPVRTVDKFLNKKRPPTDMRYSIIHPIVSYLDDNDPFASQPGPTIAELANAAETAEVAMEVVAEAEAHSTPTDILTLYARIFEEKNAEIAELRAQVKSLYEIIENQRNCPHCLYKEERSSDGKTL